MNVSEIRADYKYYLNKIKSDIREILGGGEMRRKELIDKVVLRSGLTKEQLADRSASGAMSLYRSIVGTALVKMEKYGDVAISSSGMVTLIKAPALIVKEAELAPYLIDHLKTRAYTKDELIKLAVAYFGADKTETDADEKAIAKLTSRLLPELTKRGKLRYIGGRYSIGSDSIVIKKPGSVYEEFIAYLNSKGGEFFENYSALLLDSFYKCAGMSVAACHVIGGSDDGGIDVMLKVSDWLGFSDKVLVQCKQKSSSFVTLKEVKEFVGAFYVEKGTRGIFMTTSRFHKDAAAVISSLPNIVAIDGAKLFDIAQNCGCGVRKENDACYVDYSFFGMQGPV